MAYENDVLTRNDNDELAVRTVQSVGDNPASSYDDVYTRDNNGKLAVRVVGTGGGGGSDPHNLGWYATQSALETAHPTAEDGDWAIVGSTDTVWVWDSDNNEWKDTDQKGQVESVNGQTGTVVLTASDVGAATTAQGAKADTAVQPGDLATVATSGSYDDLTDKPTIPAAQVNSDWNAVSGVAQILNKPTLGTMASESASDYTPTSGLATVATTGSYSDLSGTPTIPAPTQVSTLPTAGADELGNIYQFVGTTDANYTNGYFYKCVSDGQDPATYSWEQTDVMPAGSSLPDQTGQSGKFLTTDGTDASWATISALQNTATGTQSLTILGTPATNDYGAINIGPNSVCYGKGVAVGRYAAVMSTVTNGLALGNGAECYSEYGIAIRGRVSAIGAIQIGSSGGSQAVNSDADTFKVANDNGNFEIMSADGTIPTARLTKVNTTITLTAAGWSSNTQTVNVTGMTADGVVMVSPDPTDQSAYTSAGILCTAQAAGTLTFTCDTVPSGDIDVNVVML